jgi:DNA repair protein RadC
VVIAALLARPAPANRPEHRHGALIAYLRSVVLSPGAYHERCHVVFVDAEQRQLGDASIGLGGLNILSLRMREIFGEALRLDARGMILAHNHPSGHCRPSSCDIIATRRLTEVARALDIVLIDHLIFTDEAVYSMRAGGLL